jgi:hypothetical protein
MKVQYGKGVPEKENRGSATFKAIRAANFL